VVEEVVVVVVVVVVVDAYQYFHGNCMPLVV